MKAYIKSLNGVPVDDWGFNAYIGFKKRGMNIHFFEEIDEVPINSSNIVVSFIEDTISFFEKLGIKVPSPLHIPHPLDNSYYLGRSIRRMSMKEFLEDTRLPIFVKPDSKVKEFISGVITKKYTKEGSFKDVPLDTVVLTSEVVNIKSEYRGFVVNKELRSLNHYGGDFRIFPDVKKIEQAIEDYINAPKGYSIDFGVTDTGETILIECNDGWSLGSYGCNPITYTNLLIERWREIVNNKN